MSGKKCFLPVDDNLGGWDVSGERGERGEKMKGMRRVRGMRGVRRVRGMKGMGGVRGVRRVTCEICRLWRQTSHFTLFSHPVVIPKIVRSLSGKLRPDKNEGIAMKEILG